MAISKYLVLSARLFFFLSPPVSYLVRDPNFWGFLPLVSTSNIFGCCGLFVFFLSDGYQTVVGNAMAKSKDISDGASLDLFLNGNHVD